MQIQTTRSARARVSSAAKGLAAVAAFAVASAAQAHPGHGAESFAAGLAHPFGGLDHLLAMVAVGMWSVVALPKAWRTAGPAVFLRRCCPAPLWRPAASACHGSRPASRSAWSCSPS